MIISRKFLPNDFVIVQVLQTYSRTDSTNACCNKMLHNLSCHARLTSRCFLIYVWHTLHTSFFLTLISVGVLSMNPCMHIFKDCDSLKLRVDPSKTVMFTLSPLLQAMPVAFVLHYITLHYTALRCVALRCVAIQSRGSIQLIANMFDIYGLIQPIYF